MRKTIVLVVTLGALMALTLGAEAAVFGVDGRNVYGNGNQVVGADGVIACSNGDEYLIRVHVRDNAGNEAFGRASGVCTGSPQQWWTGQMRSDSGFSCGELVALQGQARSGGDAAAFSSRERVSCAP